VTPGPQQPQAVSLPARPPVTVSAERLSGEALRRLGAVVDAGGEVQGAADPTVATTRLAAR
jgi:hypothetical protein